MFFTNLLKPKVITIILAIAILGAAAYGFAAANIVPETGAGEGSGAISGYTITNINYTLLASDPTKIESVSMDIAATAGAGVASDVRISVDAGTTWISCTGPVTNTWTCSFGVGSEPLVSAMSNLQVVAAE